MLRPPGSSKEPLGTPRAQRGSQEILQGTLLKLRSSNKGPNFPPKELAKTVTQADETVCTHASRADHDNEWVVSASGGDDGGAEEWQAHAGAQPCCNQPMKLLKRRCEGPRTYDDGDEE